VKLNVLAINSNRLLFSPSEVKMSKNLLSSPLIQNKTDRTLLVRILVSAILDRRKERISIAELNGIGHPTNLISLCVQFLFICDLSRNSNLLYFTKI